MNSDPTVETLVERLRRGGHRVTLQRRAILEVLADDGGHLSADEIVERVRAAHPDVHQATVYRCLSALRTIGLVDHTHLGHGPAVYTLAGDAHHHLVCDGCGEVIDVPAARFEHLWTELRSRYGFEVDFGHFAVPGRCRGCSPRPRSARSRTSR